MNFVELKDRKNRGVSDYCADRVDQLEDVFKSEYKHVL